ncbi:alpha/beta hydrolase [Cupriavidus sp. TMH.W2]|uniref:alpha/beta hydrolase n=1 Tax=Cupriavidus sp. TMH.W2 TaxID=3434465 RepID=UPI003D781334
MTSIHARAPFPGLSEAQRAAMLALGRDWARDIQGNRRQVCEIYDAVHAARPAGGIRTLSAQAYGDDPRQQLDLYLPAQARAGSALPVVVFVHGGAFLRGSKDATPHIYANVPRLFARAGYLGVNMEYRLAPQSPYPGGAADVALAVDWLRRHAGELGGDARRIVLLGHSAGGSHVASYLTDPLFSARADGVAAAILVSARLEADTLPDNPNAAGVVAYYGADPAAQQRQAPMASAGRMAVPLMVAFAEHENPHLDRYALQYAERVAGAGKMPRVVQVPHHNHTSVVAHLGSADDGFAAGLLDFVATHTQPEGAAAPVR